MKRYFLSFALLLCASVGYTQVGVGTVTPASSSMMEVSSSSDGGTTFKGFMPPRVASIVERDLISPDAADYGLMVFVVGTGCLQLWDGDSWENVQCFTVSVPTNEPWINELHYDNNGPDANEGVEIAGPAGTDLSDYEIVFYNGGDGTSYDTLTLSGLIDDESNSFGALWFANVGIQNGNPDGLALVKISTGVVIQFLSYEGFFTATNDDANGMTSTDIGVLENGSTATGEALQLTGTGNQYSDFSWNAPTTHSRGDLNTGQIIN